MGCIVKFFLARNRGHARVTAASFVDEQRRRSWDVVCDIFEANKIRRGVGRGD